MNADDERDDLSDLIAAHATWARDETPAEIADAVLAAGFRRQGPITDEWEYGVEYEVSNTESVYTVAHSERQARKWVEQSPTDTGLRRRLKAGPWEEVS